MPKSVGNARWSPVGVSESELSMFGKEKRVIGGILACVVLLFSTTFAAFHSHAEHHEHGIAAVEHGAECSFCELASGSDAALVVHATTTGEVQASTNLRASGSTQLLSSDYLASNLSRAPPA